MIRVYKIKLLFFFFLATFVCSYINTSAQVVQKYKEHEIIDVGGGTKVEVLSCKGTGENEECDVIYYTDKRQLGKRKWEKVSVLVELQRSVSVPVKKTVKAEVVKPVPGFSENKLPPQKPLTDTAGRTAIKKQLGLTTPHVDSAGNDLLSKKEASKKEILKKEAQRKAAQPLENRKGSVEPPATASPKKEPAIYISSIPAAYTLEQCYRLGLERNINIKQVQNRLSTNRLDGKSARYSLLPSVSYNIGHYFSFGKNIDPVTNVFVNESFSGGYTALGMQLQLFAGFSRVHAIRQNAYVIQATQYAQKSAELELLTNITLTYARLLFNKEQILLERNNMQSTLRQLDIVNEKIEVGRLTKYEAYTFNARLSSEEANLIVIQNDSSAASQYLKQLLNVPYKQQVDIAPFDTLALAGINTSSIEYMSFLDSVVRNHPSVKQAEKEELVARMAEKIAKSNFYPSVNLGGNLASNYNINQTNQNNQKIPLAQQINNNLGQNINLSLRVPIFSQLENENRVKKEKINISNAQLARQLAENSVVTNTLQLLNDYKAAKQTYAATLNARDQNILSYSLYEEKHKVGQVSSVELFAARDLLNASNTRHLQAKLQLFFQYRLIELLKL